jgi:hypothetical protein
MKQFESSLDPERLYELVKLKTANSQTGFRPSTLIIYDSIF